MVGSKGRVELFHHVWAKQNGKVEIRVLLDDNKRYRASGEIFLLVSPEADLYFYCVGEPLDEGFLIGMAIQVYERAFDIKREDTLLLWSFLGTH
jgi:hypothetical protein